MHPQRTHSGRPCNSMRRTTDAHTHTQVTSLQSAAASNQPGLFGHVCNGCMLEKGPIRKTCRNKAAVSKVYMSEGSREGAHNTSDVLVDAAKTYTTAAGAAETVCLVAAETHSPAPTLQRANLWRHSTLQQHAARTHTHPATARPPSMPSHQLKQLPA